MLQTKFNTPILIALLILMLVPIQASEIRCDTPKPELLTGTMKTDYFRVHFDPIDSYLPQLMSETARIALMRISHDLGYQPEKNRLFTLNVYRTHLSFINAGGLEDSKFTVGMANIRDQAISVDASGVFVSPDETIAHEITHAVIFRALDARIIKLPLWANEGIAQYESEESSDSDNTIVANAAADGSLIPLGYLVKDFPKDKTDLAYAESASAIRFMVKEYGKSSTKLLITQLGRTGSFDKAMLKATGRTGDQFANDWLHSVTKKYLVVMITRVATGIISVIMAILAVIAFFVRRKQKIEAARRWEQEEFEEAMRRQLGNDWCK